MRKTILIFLFCLAGWGCVIPAAGAEQLQPPGPTPAPSRTPAARNAGSLPARAAIPDPAPSPTPPALCRVHTDYPGGHVNIRGGPGMGFPVLAVAADKDILTLTGRADPAGWSEVRNQAGLVGWFYIRNWCE